MDGDVLVSLLVASVFLLEVHVVAADNDCSLHFGGAHDATENAASDGDVAGEGALLVDVLCVDGLLWDFIAETDFAEVTALSFLTGVHGTLFEDAVLLLIGAFVLLDVIVKIDVAFDHFESKI